MTRTAYETRKFTGRWVLPWGTVTSWAYETSTRRPRMCTECSVELNEGAMWNALLRAARGQLRRVAIRDIDQWTQFEFLDRQNQPRITLLGRWIWNDIHGYGLRFEHMAPSQLADSSTFPQLFAELRAAFALLPSMQPNLLFERGLVHWMPAINVGELRRKWEGEQRPGCGELLLYKRERKDRETATFEFRSNLATIQPEPQLNTPSNEGIRVLDELVPDEFSGSADVVTDSSRFEAQLFRELAQPHTLRDPAEVLARALESDEGVSPWVYYLGLLLTKRRGLGAFEEPLREQLAASVSVMDARLSIFEPFSSEVRSTENMRAAATDKQSPEREEQALDRIPESAFTFETTELAKTDNVLEGDKGSGGFDPERPTSELQTKSRDFASSRSTEKPAILPDTPARDSGDNDDEAADLLLERLRELRKKTQDRDVREADIQDIDALLKRYPDRAEVYLLAFELFESCHNLTRAGNILSALEQREEIAAPVRYELARARKRFANLTDKIGRGPKQSLDAWIRYALYRPLDADAFQRVLRFSEDVGIHDLFLELLKKRVVAIVEREAFGESVLAGGASELPREDFEFPIDAIYPALLLLALTSRRKEDDRSARLETFRDHNNYPEEWWDDAKSFIDGHEDMPSLREEAEDYAAHLRTLKEEIAEMPSATDEDEQASEATNSNAIPFPTKSESEATPAASVEENRDNETSNDSTADDSLFKAASDDEALDELEELARIGGLDDAIKAINDLLKQVESTELRFQLLLRKARWLREKGAPEREVAFALTGVRILHPHSIEAHLEFIALHLREGSKAKAREAALSLLDSLVEAHEPEDTDYEEQGVLDALADVGFTSSRMLPSRVQSDLEEHHPNLIELLGDD